MKFFLPIYKKRTTPQNKNVCGVVKEHSKKLGKGKSKFFILHTLIPHNFLFRFQCGIGLLRSSQKARLWTMFRRSLLRIQGRNSLCQLRAGV